MTQISAMYGTVLCIGVALALCFLQGQRSGIRRNGKRLPRPPGSLPFAGNGFWFLSPRHKLLARFADFQASAGFETLEISVPSLPPAIVINDPKNVEYVLKNNDLFVKGTFFRSRSWDLFGNGIINADGELWRVQRKAGLRFFSNANLKNLIDQVLPPILKDTRRQLNEVAANGSIVDMQHVLLELTTRIMGKAAYDMDIDGSLPFSQAFDLASGMTNKRFSNPFYKITEFFLGARFRSAVVEVKAFGKVVVSAALEKRSLPSAAPKSSGSSYAPLQTNLIDSLLDNISSPEIVADAAMNFLSAGRDTTAQALTWTLYLLSRHPHIVSRIREELASVFYTDPTGSALNISYDVVASTDLPYTLAVFSESLRLYPSVPFELKESLEPTTFPDGTYLPGGSVVLWVPWALGRSPSIWGPDALEFKPERWIERGLDGKMTFVVTRNAFENPVFNAGPRMCLGKKLAENLAVAVLGALVWEWDIEEVLDKAKGGCGVGGERTSQDSLTLPMQGGLPATVRRRIYC